MGAWLALAVLTAFVYPAAAHAADLRKADRVEIAADEVIDDTLIAFGDAVVIRGHVRGDALAFARTVTVKGTVDGNLITAADRIDLDGAVHGSVMIAGQNVTVGGLLGSQLYAAGRSLNLGNELEVAGDAILTGSAVDVAGAIGRDVYAMGERIEIDATMARDLVISGANLRVGGTTTVGRDLSAQVDGAEDLVLEGGASISGETYIELDALNANKRYDDLGFYLWKIAMIAAGLVFGLVAYMVVPDLFQAPRERKQWLRMIGIGLLGLFAIPVVSIITAATLVGIPLAAVTMGGYLLALYLGKIVVAAELGRRLLRFRAQRKRSELVWSLLLGLVLVMVLVELPYIGGVLGFIVAVLGLGTVSNYLFELRDRRAQRRSADETRVRTKLPEP
ncbi:hypothetical protein [Enhygromyxa salina]|uniref:hypothetical protein n=1 Tax=Enhygromyxa salina TaxID=215803 RepID=UPI0015E5C340|nr:hypothetical protein [Enhygromyxa salina]